MHRPVQRISRILACAAVPVIFVAAGCSSGSDDSASGADGAKKSASASGASTGASGKATAKDAKPARAKYAKLPEPCKALPAKTVKELVPSTKDKSGSMGTSDDVSARGTCSWNSLKSNGVDGSQYRWLSVSFVRFDSDATLGTGDKRAAAYQAKQLRAAQATEGAKSIKTEPVAGLGDSASGVRYDLKKKEGSFKQQTVLARSANAVITVDYNGAGLAGDKTPDADDLMKDAEGAAKDALAAVATANGLGSDPTSSASPSKKPDSKESESSKDSKPDSDKKSSASPSPSKSASKDSTKD